MKYFFLLIIFIVGVNSSSAQTVSTDSISSQIIDSLLIHTSSTDSILIKMIFTEMMEERPYLTDTVIERYYTGPTYPDTLSYRHLDNEMIENPAIRYSIQNLEKEKYEDVKVDDAISTIIEYAENEHLKDVVDFLREYTTQNMTQKEQALIDLQEYITADSINFLKNHEHSLNGIYEDYLNTDLQVITDYVRSDSNYIWIRDASRDSVKMEILNMNDNSIEFWANNGRIKAYRFWAVNELGDTIPTWIEVLAGGNKLKIHTDADVYQPKMEKKEINISLLYNPFNNNLFKLKPITIGKLDRRYWTYYAEVALAVNQGKVANWNGGGENSWSLLTNLKYFLNYKKNNTSLANWVHYRFGFMTYGEEDMRKSDDRFELNSILGQKAFKHWDYSLKFNMLTQLLSTYDYPKDKDRVLKSNFMSPGYFTLSLGINFKPKSNFSLFLSPIAGRWTVIRDTNGVNPDNYGISEEGKKHKREIGLNVTMWSKVDKIFDVMSIENHLEGFMSYEEKDRYLNMGKENEEKKKIPIDLLWKMTLKFHINYFMDATIWTETKYNENYSRKLQFKENLNLGVNFRF